MIITMVDNGLQCGFCVIEVFQGQRAEDAVNGAVTLIMGSAVCRYHAIEGVKEGSQGLSEAAKREAVMGGPDDGGDPDIPDDLPEGLSPDDVAPDADEKPSMFPDKGKK